MLNKFTKLFIIKYLSIIVIIDNQIFDTNKLIMYHQSNLIFNNMLAIQNLKKNEKSWKKEKKMCRY